MTVLLADWYVCAGNVTVEVKITTGQWDHGERPEVKAKGVKSY